MKIKLLSDMVIEGDNVKSGKIVEVSSADARFFIGGGHAESHLENPKKTKEETKLKKAKKK